MNASRLLVLSIALSPAILLGQKKEELVSIQRDVAQLEDQVKQLQRALDEKMAALMALVQQSIDLSNKTATAMGGMQRDVDQKLSEQQSKLVSPVASLGTKVDEMSGDFRSVRENVAELVRHMNDLDTKVSDISSAVRTLSAPAAIPPPPANTAAGAAAASDVPPMSAEALWNAAYTDFQGKKDETAIEEFAHYLKYYRQTANAPNAQFYIGQIYYRIEDWPSAVKAFDAVLEGFPKNPKTSEAQYMKACALMKNKEKTAAGKEFKSLIATYPDSPRVRDAHAHLRELGLDSTPGRRKN